MTIFQSVILGIFQGITEFLPISSSGHLVLLQHFFGIKEGNLFFTEMLHFGTLISIFVVYFKDIIRIIVEFFKMLGNGVKNKRLKITNSYQRLGVLIIIGSIPTALMGILLEKQFEKLYSSILAVGFAFLITGMLLWIADKNPSENKKARDMTILDALVIGTFQGIAIAPGISRSGSTIVGGLFRGLNRKLATEFSFLMALPATFGAAILGIKDVVESGTEITFSMPLLIGVILSAIVGIFSINILVGLLQKKKLHYFSYYLWILGIILIIAQFI